MLQCNQHSEGPENAPQYAFRRLNLCDFGARRAPPNPNPESAPGSTSSSSRKQASNLYSALSVKNLEREK